MTRHTNILTLSTPADAPVYLSRCFGSLAAHIVAWVTTCADYYAAAALYEQLSRLSDAELKRRGMTRAELHRYVFETTARGSSTDCTRV